MTGVFEETVTPEPKDPLPQHRDGAGSASPCKATLVTEADRDSFTITDGGRLHFVD